MAIYVEQPKKGKKLTYKDLPQLQIKEHYNGIVETCELGELILTSWEVAESIIPQERIETDGSRKYYIPFLLEWSTQFNNKELMEQIKNKNAKFYVSKAQKLVAEKIQRGEFIPAEES